MMRILALLLSVTAVLDEVVRNQKVDEDRICVTGLSMGGFGTWELAAYSPKLTIYPDAGHDSWTETYNNSEFYDWLLAQKRMPVVAAREAK